MNEDEIAREVVDAAVSVQREPGPGLLNGLAEENLCGLAAWRDTQSKAESDSAANAFSLTSRFHQMKRLKVIWIGLVALAILAIPTSLAAQPTVKIEEGQIVELLKSLDSVLLKKDAKAACAHFADDATITIVLLERGEKYTDIYDKKKYQANLEAGFSNFDDYTSRRSGTKVRVAADGKTATAESTFVEDFRRNGIKMGCTTKESYSFVLRDGRILIKTMSNEAKMQ